MPKQVPEYIYCLECTEKITYSPKSLKDLCTEVVINTNQSGYLSEVYENIDFSDSTIFVEFSDCNCSPFKSATSCKKDSCFAIYPVNYDMFYAEFCDFFRERINRAVIWNKVNKKLIRCANHLNEPIDDKFIRCAVRKRPFTL